MYDLIDFAGEKRLLPFRFNAIVNVSNKSYFISCTDTFDEGIELMAFEMAEKREEKLGKNYSNRDPLFELPGLNDVDWGHPIYEARYDSIEKASDGFDYVITNLKEILICLERVDDDEC